MEGTISTKAIFESALRRLIPSLLALLGADCPGQGNKPSEAGEAREMLVIRVEHRPMNQIVDPILLHHHG
jgi:hypothetical protein